MQTMSKKVFQRDELDTLEAVVEAMRRCMEIVLFRIYQNRIRLMETD